MARPATSRRLCTVLHHVTESTICAAVPVRTASVLGPGVVDLDTSMTFVRGPPMKNRFMLAPLTNEQSGPDGVLSDDEYHWLVKRAEGGFGLTMTCASHVQRVGQGFSGQLGCWSDDHLEGLTRLAAGIKLHESISVVQLHHAGIRSPARLIGEAPVGPSKDDDTSSRELSTAEVEELIEDFIVGAERCEAAGFDGVELHGAHGSLHVCHAFPRSVLHKLVLVAVGRIYPLPVPLCRDQSQNRPLRWLRHQPGAHRARDHCRNSVALPSRFQRRHPAEP